MKIGIDCHNLEGNRTGVGRYLWNLLREWSDIKDHEFFLYFKNEIPEDMRGLLAPSPAAAGFSRAPHIRNLNVRSNALFKHLALPRAAKKDGVDVLFCPDYVLPIYMGHPRKATSSPRGKRKSHIRTAVTIHDIIYEARPNEYSWPSFADKVLLRWASKRSAKKADVIFVPSEFTKKEILKYYKIDSEKVIVTPLAPDPIFKKLDFSDGKIRQGWEDIKAKYGIRDKFIFFVGSIFNRRFLPQKIKAFENFVKSNPEFQFLVIGENHTKPHQDIRTQINAANGRLGRNKIVWQKHIRDDRQLVYMYNKAYVTLWLSSYEGFGLPVLESMACGTPVVTTRYGSLGEVAKDAAIYVEDPANPKEIEAVLTRLVEDSDCYNDLSHKSLLRVQSFSWQRTAEKTLKNLI